MTSKKEDFNTIYHRLREGDNDQLDAAGIGLFESLADCIIDLGPSSVLDAGGGRGHLIKALRAKGVEVWGIVNSEQSFQDVLPEAQPFCQIGSVLKPFPQQHYDLIVCIDLFEHLSSKDAIQAVENLCIYTDDILFSSIPVDFNGSVHVNVQPPEYWAALFYRFGFIHDLDFNASLIAPWAMRLLKAQPQLEDRILSYERKIWLLSQEVALRRDLNVEYKNELSRKEMDLQYWKPQRLQAELDAIRNSTSWQLITRIQRFREQIIPLGSRRESAMRRVFHGMRVFRREGVTGFSSLVFHKLKTSLEIKSSNFWHKFKLRHSTLPKTGQVCEIDGLLNRPAIELHSVSVDIIICVHNALEDVRHCLDSLLEHTTQPYHLILVDDGSSDLTAQYLREFAHTHQAQLLRSDEATGYPSAANRGMRASSAEFLVLLNSDTILTPGWIDRLVACIQSDEMIGAVGPLSNTASWQSVPKIEESGDWASNPLPRDLTPAGMALLIASNSARLYVEMPLLNGFCLLIRRKLLDEVGVFDEANFSQGYGEEDDLILRARNSGWKMALADDVYIYHAQSKSYSSDQRHALSERAQKILRSKHGERMISESVHFCRQDPLLEGIRARAQVTYDRQQCIRAGMQFTGRRLLFVFSIIQSPGGGANVIRSEGLAMQKMGAKISFFHLEARREGFIESYPDLAPYTIFGKAEDLEFASQGYDAVIATYNPTVPWLKPIQAKKTHPILGYYIQGFEPMMYLQPSQSYKTALESYTLIDDMILFTKTEWTRQKVREATGRESSVIGPSVDIDLYRPRPRNTPQWPNGPLRIAVMIRPESPYREPLKTMQLLCKAAQKYKGEIEIDLFGTPPDNPAFLELPHDFPWKSYGILNPSQVAKLLGQADIFVDYSSHQAMGLTAMEAMACGCAVIVPQNGGASTYARNEHNSLVVDTSAFEKMWAALQRLIEDESLRNTLIHNAIHDICAYFPEQAALNMLKTLFLR